MIILPFFKGDIMRHLCLLLTLFLPLNFVLAQSITVGTISKSIICFGDTIWVPYSSSGTFQADNFFSIQLSDASGSFTTFTNVGKSTAMQDSVPIVIGYTADHFRFRIISTDPYIVSSNTSSEIQVVNYPTPSPTPNPEHTDFGAAGFTGDEIQFKDGSSEPTGSTYLWKFDQDANTVWSTTESPMVIYTAEGVKTGTVTVTNSAGCSTTKPFQLRILSCHPVIPDSVHIVTGYESGAYPFVWVKAGGNYSANGSFPSATIFIEAGASVRAEIQSVGTYYVKNGSSFIDASEDGYSTVILSPGNSISFSDYGYNIDTFYCGNLQFDYSQVGGNAGVQVTGDPLQILTTNNSLCISNNGADISVSVMNLLGATILSKSDRDILSLDLSPLVNGVYFAIITSGNHREVRKIAVVH